MWSCCKRRQLQAPGRNITCRTMRSWRSSALQQTFVLFSRCRPEHIPALSRTLLKGPVIQDELNTQIIFAGPIGFRQHEVVLVGDAEEMYRQVQVHVDDTSLQRVFFRFSADESIKLYQPITYGLTSSSFLAIRALHQLAADEGVVYPEAAEAIIENFYVVD